jgi:hypothetical protein
MESTMPRVFVAQHHAEAHLVTGLLQSNGITAEVRGEALFTTIEAPSVIPGAAPEVWVANFAQVPLALDLVNRFSRGEAMPGESGPNWQCPKCSETLEAQFTECWNCSTSRPGLKVQPVDQE